MSNNVVYIGDPRAGELTQKILDCVNSYDGRIPLATVLGCLEIAKISIVNVAIFNLEED